MQSDEVGNEGEVEGLNLPELLKAPTIPYHSIPGEGKGSSHNVTIVGHNTPINQQSAPKILRGKMIQRQWSL